MKVRRSVMARYLSMAVLMVLTAVSTVPAQEARPEEAQQAAPATESPKPQELLNTSGKVRLSLQGALGLGFDKVDVGTTTSGIRSRSAEAAEREA